MVKKLLSKAYTALIYIFLYAPIVIMMIYSFNASKFRNKWGGFSFKWYGELFKNRQIMKALGNTILVAASSAIISTIIGVLAAWALHNLKSKKLKSSVMNVTQLPMLNPDIVTGVSLMMLFVFFNIPRGFGTMLMAHITFSVPYVILSIMPKFKQFNNNLYEAALDLGATPWQAFLKIVMPELLPGIMTGMLLAFTLSIDDFVISFFTTGPGVSNLSILIYSITKKQMEPTINALSTIMFFTVLFLLIIVNLRLQDKSEKKRKEDF